MSWYRDVARITYSARPYLFLHRKLCQFDPVFEQSMLDVSTVWPHLLKTSTFLWNMIMRPQWLSLLWIYSSTHTETHTFPCWITTHKQLSCTSFLLLIQGLFVLFFLVLGYMLYKSCCWENADSTQMDAKASAHSRSELSQSSKK